MSTRTGALTRAIAIDALTHVLTRRIHADVALDKLFAHHEGLRPLDRAFVFEMVYGALRWLSKMDWIMSHMMERSFSSLDPRVANALRIGTYQIYYMDRVPVRAAVSETVEAMRLVGAQNAVSFVNAILRRVARKAEYFAKPDKVKTPAEYYAMHYAHPKWMVERWLRDHSPERVEHVCQGNNMPPKQTVRILTRNPVPDGTDLASFMLREYGIASSWRPLKQCLHLEKLPPFGKCEAFAKGSYMVQDEAAQLVCSVVKASPTDRVLDACAAPGGKAIYLWDEGVTPENLVVCDSAQKRIEVLKRNFERVGLQGCEMVHADAAEYSKGKKFNKIVLDAPCSALGVIRRHPEIKWLRSLSDIERNAREQARLLEGLAPAVEVGGEIVYIVCSNESEETIQQVDRFLASHQNFSIAPLQGRLHDYYRKYVTRRDELLVLPGNPDDVDGFYCAVLRRDS